MVPPRTLSEGSGLDDEWLEKRPLLVSEKPSDHR
jgi:hypothetical protein